MLLSSRISSSYCYPDAFVSDMHLLLIRHVLCWNLMLEFFQETQVISDLTKFINNVCVRDFMNIIKQMHYDMVMKKQELYLANMYEAYNTPTHMLPQAMYFSHNVIQMGPQKFAVPQVNKFENATNNTLETCVCLIKLDISETLIKLNLDDIYVADTCIVTLVDNSNDDDDNDDDIWNDIKELVYDRISLMIFSKGYLILENKLR